MPGTELLHAQVVERAERHIRRWRAGSRATTDSEPTKWIASGIAVRLWARAARLCFGLVETGGPPVPTSGLFPLTRGGQDFVEVPLPDRPVAADRDELLAIGRDHEIIDELRVCLKPNQQLS